VFVLPDGSRFAVPRDPARYRERLQAAFPDEADAIATYVDTIEAIDAALTGGGPPDAMLAHLDDTLGDCFDELGLSSRLRTILAGEHGTYALPPSRASLVLHAALVMHYLKGAYYPEGGGQVIADSLVAFIEAHGGEVVLRTPVERIVVADGKVTGVRLRPPSPERARGVPTELPAPVVVSNADLCRTVDELVGAEHLDADFVERTHGFSMALPLFVVYLVIDRDLGAEGFANANIYVIGAGGMDAEFAAFGLDVRTPRQKVDGLDEALQILHGLWTEPTTTVDGSVYRTDGARIEPKPPRPIPVWIGGFGPRSMRLVGRRADGWLPSLAFVPPARVLELRDIVRAAADEAGRDPDAITYAYNVSVRIGDPVDDERLLSGSAAEVTDRLAGLIDRLGLTAVNIWPADDAADQVDAFAAEVLVALR
jgi:hypothetical protein